MEIKIRRIVSVMLIFMCVFLFTASFACGANLTSLKDGRVKIWVPSGWVVNENPPSADIQLTSPDGDSLIQLTKGENAGGAGLRQFVAAWETSTVGPTMTYYQKLGENNLKVSQADAYQGQYRVKYNGKEFVAAVSFFIKGDYVYIVTCVAKWPDEKFLRPLFNRALRSLEIDPNIPVEPQEHPAAQAARGEGEPSQFSNIFEQAAMGYTIRYPDDWVFTKPSDYQVVFSGKENTGAYYSTVSIQNVVPSGEDGAHDTVYSLKKILMDQMNEGATNVKIYNEKPVVWISKNNTVLNGQEFTAEYVRENEYFKQWFVILPRENNGIFYVWSYTSPLSQYDVYFPIVMSMLNSWEIG